VRYTDIVSAASFGLDDRTLLTAHADQAVRLWDRTTGKLLWKNPLLTRDGPLLAVSPTGQLAVAAEYSIGKIHVWKVPSGELVGRFPHPGVLCLAFSSDGRFLVGGGFESRLWDVLTDKMIDWIRQPEKEKVTAVVFSRDGRLLLTGGSDNTVRRWDATTGRPIGEALQHDGSVEAVAFSLDDRTILSATDTGLVYRWDRGTGAPLGQPLQPQDMRGGLPRFSPDGRIVLSAFGDGVVRLRDVATGKSIGPSLRHFGDRTTIAFGPDSRNLLTLDRDRRVAQLWQIPAPLTGERDRVRCWIESITGLELDSDGTMHVLDAPSWQQRQRRLSEMGGSP
jgi:WD40 repeat protein